MPVGPSARTAPSKTGQDNIFAAHLATASQEQTITVQQESRSRQESGSAEFASQSPDSEKSTINADAPDDVPLDATINGAAGATGVATPLVQSFTADAELARNQSMASTRGEDSLVSRMLDSLTSITGDAKAAVQDGNPTPLKTTPENTGTPAPSSPSFSEGSGIIQIDNTSVQSRATVSVAPDAASGNGQSQSAESLPSRQQEAVQKGTDQLVQNKYGQIFTIHQSGEAEEMMPIPVAAGTTASIGTNHNLNITGNYIHAHLPNDAARTAEKDGNGQQQETAKDNQQKDANPVKITMEGQTHPEQAVSPKFQIAVGQESQSLIFAHQQASASLVASTDSTSSTAFSLLRLPSGLSVPSGTIVDQMIAHFSVNRQMESSSVNLKLHPQELGEVRMEIKIHQDNIKAHIIAQNPQAEEMINRHLPRLREALEQQGLHLQQIDVTVATQDNNSGKERFQEQAGQQQMRPSIQNRSTQPVFSLDTAEGTEEATNNLSVLA